MPAHLHTHTHAHTDICAGKSVLLCASTSFLHPAPHVCKSHSSVFLTRGQISNPQPQSYLLYMIVNSSSQLPEKESERERKRSILYQECVLSLLCNRLSVSLDLCTSRGPRLG